MTGWFVATVIYLLGVYLTWDIYKAISDEGGEKIPAWAVGFLAIGWPLVEAFSLVGDVIYKEGE